MQALPLNRKIQITQTRIIEWYQRFNGKVCISFSGGKDSTVLLHIARQIYPDIPAVFSNTGLEYPEIQRFVRSKDNIDIVTPSMRFDQVVSTYGYPLISKEVAEVIYYARKIRPQSDDIDEKDETPPKESSSEVILISTSHSRARRTCLQGKWITMHRDGSRAGKISKADYEKDPQWYDYEPGKRWQYELQGFKKNGVESTKSQFNKEKWLSLARDIPAMISHYCCFKMKKSPMKKYQHDNGYVPIIGTLAEESRVRRQAWIKHGCNAFDGKNPTSQPLSFWTEQDILTYIVENNLDIASVYGEIVSTDEYGNECPPIDLTGKPGCNLKCTGCTRTGCIFCGFGFHLDKGETRFQRLARTHPKQYEYSISGGQWVDNPAYDPTAPKMDGEWQNWNPKKIWVPSKQGLGMGKVFDMVNEIYGKDFYRYE